MKSGRFPIDLVQVHISNTFQHYNVAKYSKIILKNAEHQYTINAQAETRHSDHNTTRSIEISKALLISLNFDI